MPALKHIGEGFWPPYESFCYVTVHNALGASTVGYDSKVLFSQYHIH